MDKRTATAVARELLAIQGNAEDAKLLLDSTLTRAEQAMIEEAIDELTEGEEDA